MYGYNMDTERKYLCTSKLFVCGILQIMNMKRTQIFIFCVRAVFTQYVHIMSYES